MADITIPIILILILTMTIPLILAVAILVGATQVAAMEVAVAAEINASLLKGEIIGFHPFFTFVHFLSEHKYIE